MEVLKICGYKKTIMYKDGKVKIVKQGGVFSTKREKVIPASNISGIEVKKPGLLIKGYIQIQIAGQTSGNSSFTFTGGAYEVASDENAILFHSDEDYETAKEIQRQILDFNARSNSPSSLQPLLGADELLKFKQMLDSGILTQEEFNAKKQQILSR